MAHLRGLELIWNKSTNKIHHDWKMIRTILTKIIGKTLDKIKDVKNSPVKNERIYPIPEPSEVGEDQTHRVVKEERNKQTIFTCNEDARCKKDKYNRKFKGLQIENFDEKVKSQLYLAPGISG